MNKSVILHLATLMQCVCSASAAALVQNTGFEVGTGADAQSWGKAREPYAFVEHEGRNGTKALFFDVKKDSPYTFPSQRVRLEPGQSYLVEGWIRTEGLAGDGVGAALALEWWKKDGTWGNGKYSSGMKGTSSGFEKVELQVAIPSDADICTLSPYVTKGMVGQVWFDDLSITPFEGPALGALVTDAYRNVAVKGIVQLTAVVLMRSEEQTRRGIKGTFFLKDANDRPFAIPSEISGAYARAKVDVGRLPMGRSEIVFRLTDAQGKIIGESKTAFERVKAFPKWPVRIDGTRTLVDGKPFYPLGVYLMHITRETLTEIKQGAFNCVMSYDVPTRGEMDLAHEMGLKVIYAINGAFYGTRACVKEITSLESEHKWVKDHVLEFKDHPALLAWYLNDELGVEIRDRLIARRNFVAELDPGHPTYVALYQTDDFPAYVGSFDVFGGDPYPICQVGDPPISQVTEHTRLAREAACGGAMWQIPQLFDWGAYRVKDAPNTRPPTFDEFRNMAWQFVVEGAMGLIPYSIHSVHKMDWRDPFSIQWQKHCAISHEIAAYQSAFLSVEPAPEVNGAPDGVGVRTWHANGRDYVLCVNTTRKPVSAVLEIAGHGKVPLALGPIGVEMKELRRK